jgi:hypothetical protein
MTELRDLIIGTFTAATLAGLGLMHLFWAVGGQIDSDRIVPRRTVVDPSSGMSRQVAAFVPSARTTLVVALALIGAATLVAMRAGLFAGAVSHWTVQAAVGGIALVFVARAVGDFKLVGFFKRNDGTAFARWDSWLYSPLCVALAASSAFVAWR